MTQPRDTHVNLIPVIRYSDCSAALTMFTEVFGSPWAMCSATMPARSCMASSASGMAA